MSAVEKKRLYHIVCIHEKTGVKATMTLVPMSHAECCIMLPKCKTTSRKWAKLLRYQLEEVT